MHKAKIDLITSKMEIPPISQVSHAEQITGFHRSTLRRWWEEGKFPRPQKLNGTTLVWATETIMDWIKENIEGV